MKKLALLILSLAFSSNAHAESIELFPSIVIRDGQTYAGVVSVRNGSGLACSWKGVETATNIWLEMLDNGLWWEPETTYQDVDNGGTLERRFRFPAASTGKSVFRCCATDGTSDSCSVIARGIIYLPEPGNLLLLASSAALLFCIGRRKCES